jgi:hypothetical protein
MNARPPMNIPDGECDLYYVFRLKLHQGPML